MADEPPGLPGREHLRAGVRGLAIAGKELRVWKGVRQKSDTQSESWSGCERADGRGVVVGSSALAVDDRGP